MQDLSCRTQVTWRTLDDLSGLGTPYVVSRDRCYGSFSEEPVPAAEWLATWYAVHTYSTLKCNCIHIKRPEANICVFFSRVSYVIYAVLPRSFFVSTKWTEWIL